MNNNGPKVKIKRAIGRPPAFPSPWLELTRAMKGVAAVAKAIGRSPRQVNRIAHRECPFEGAVKLLTMAAAKKHGLAKAFEEWDRETR